MKHILLLTISWISCTLGLYAQNDPFGAQTNYTAVALSPGEFPSFQEYNHAPQNIHVSSITAPELRSTIEASRGKFYLLDARSNTEYKVSHIQSARPLDYNSFSIEQVWMLDRSAHVVVYSAAKGRSLVLAQYLKLMGFLDVQILDDGLIGWKNSGQVVYDHQGETDRIHVGSRANLRLVKSGLAVL